MNLSSLRFFSQLRGGQKQFAVIGLGRFGRAVCETLHQMGYEVLGVDADERHVTRALNDHILAHAIQLDSTERPALEEAGLFDFDTAIVAIGNYIEASVITTLNLKEGGVDYVLAKASSSIHGKLLRKVGANLVVFPEYEMGCEIARALTRPNILERFELDPNHSIVEVVVPQAFHGKTIQELQLRSNYGLNVLAVGYDPQAKTVTQRDGEADRKADGDAGEDEAEKFEINPPPNTRLYQGMAMVVIGTNRSIDRLPF